MGADTLISWADMTFNAWVGCQKVSPACDGCYAAHLMETRFGRVVFGGPGKGVGTRDRTSPSNWAQPRKWNRQAIADGTRPFVFGGSLMDVFDSAVDPAWRRDYFKLILETPNLVWLLLTKRPQNIIKLVDEVGYLPRNAALGTTAEDRKRVETNLPALMKAARLHPLFLFLSAEPLLEDLGDLSPWLKGDQRPGHLAPGETFDGRKGAKLNRLGNPKPPALAWVITGGETDQGDHKARPVDPQAYRSLRDQCAKHGVAYHHKQNGEHDGMTRVGKALSGRLLDGKVHDARPVIA